MYTVLACLLATAAAAPATYDQRQDGELNMRADVQNILFLITYPEKILTGLGFRSNTPSKRSPEIQDRADVQAMEAFVEPNTPYRVEIGSEERLGGGGDGRAVEVVIAGRRHIDPDAIDRLDREIKLIGATEQCGPDRERDPDTLMCRARSEPEANSDIKPAQEDEKEVVKEKEVVAEPNPEVVAS